MNTRFYLYMWNGSYKEPATFMSSYYMRDFDWIVAKERGYDRLSFVRILLAV